MTTNETHTPPARWPIAAAWAIFLAWVAISALANYAHGRNAVAGLLLAAAPVGFAAVTFLLEMLVSRGHRLGWPSVLAMVAVASGAGVASYIGLAGMAIENGVDTLTARLLPLAFDGVVLAASLAIRALANPPMANARPAPVSAVDVTMAELQLHREAAMAEVDKRRAALDTDSAPDTATPVDAIDLEATLAKHGLSTLPSDADMALAMDMLVAEVAEVAPVSPAPAGTRRTKVAEPIVVEAIREAHSQGMRGGKLEGVVAFQTGLSERSVRRRVAALGLS